MKKILTTYCIFICLTTFGQQQLNLVSKDLDFAFIENYEFVDSLFNRTSYSLVDLKNKSVIDRFYTIDNDQVIQYDYVKFATPLWNALESFYYFTRKNDKIKAAEAKERLSTEFGLSDVDFESYHLINLLNDKFHHESQIIEDLGTIVTSDLIDKYQLTQILTKEKVKDQFKLALVRFKACTFLEHSYAGYYKRKEYEFRVEYYSKKGNIFYDDFATTSTKGGKTIKELKEMPVFSWLDKIYIINNRPIIKEHSIKYIDIDELLIIK